MFGENPKLGLASSNLPIQILEKLKSKEDLMALHQCTPVSVDSDLLEADNNQSRSATGEPL